MLAQLKRPKAVLISVALLALACGDDATSPSSLDPVDVEGGYRLARINDQALPFDDGDCCRWVGGSLDLRGGDYTMEVVTRTLQDVVTFTITEHGRYRLQGDGVAFEAEEGEIVASTGDRQSANLLLDAGTLLADTLKVPFGQDRLVGSFERTTPVTADRVTRR